MKTITKVEQQNISPNQAIEILKNGNRRFVQNLSLNRNLLQQMNETTEGQNPFAVIISCMDSRTSAELIFDQGLGDIFSIRIAGNVINDDILGSAEFGCKAVGSKVILVLGHTKCGAVKGAMDKVELGHLHSVTSKIQRCIHDKSSSNSSEDLHKVTHDNVILGIKDLRSNSSILKEMEEKGQIKIVGGIYDIASGEVNFFEA
jgi:carbonic anhydrase